MAFTINTNILSLNAQRNLRNTQGPLAQAMQRLSSGLRINSAKDDAAGLAIATRMSSQIRGLTVSVRNASDGLSIAQTSEGSMDEITNNLQRIRELAVQAKSGQYSASDVSYMQMEVNTLTEEIGRIGDQTKFNNVKLFDGNFSANLSVSFAASDASINVALSNVQIRNAGATQTGTYNSANMGGTAWNTAAAGNPSGVAAGTSRFGLSQISNATGYGGTNGVGQLWQKTGANYFTGTVIAATNADGSTYTGRSNASNTIAIVDGALNFITSARSYLGAKANQLEAAMRNLDNVIETTQASKSRIMDADFAAETANLTKSMILQQAGISVLSQANSAPQNVLALIR